MRSLLSAVVAALALAVSTSAQTALISVTWEMEQFGPNPTGTTTLYSDGTVSTDVNFLPDPPDAQLPPSLIPPGADPGGTVDVGTISGGEDAVTAAVGVTIGAYLVGEWIDYGIEVLRAELKELFEHQDVSADFNDKVVDEVILYLRQNS